MNIMHITVTMKYVRLVHEEDRGVGRIVTRPHENLAFPALEVDQGWIAEEGMTGRDKRKDRTVKCVTGGTVDEISRYDVV